MQRHFSLQMGAEPDKIMRAGTVLDGVVEYVDTEDPAIFAKARRRGPSGMRASSREARRREERGRSKRAGK